MGATPMAASSFGLLRIFAAILPGFGRLREYAVGGTLEFFCVLYDRRPPAMLPPTPMADDSDPPRKHYQLKPKQFETVNERVSASTGPAAPGGRDPGPAAGDPGRIDVRDLFKQAAASGPLRPAQKSAAPANDVQALLQANTAHEAAAGLHALTPQAPRRSRRKRDYWISLFAAYAVIGGALKIASLNLMSIAFAAAGAIIVTLGLTWIYWFVLDDY
jgi:hypothetical protein